MSSQTPIRQPLTTKFFADMLNLEMAIQSRTYDFNSIDELIQLYAVISKNFFVKLNYLSRKPWSITIRQKMQLNPILWKRYRS